MKTVFIILMIEISGLASATTYYVSASSGNDANSGTSSGTAWQTIAKVNSQALVPGDSVLFRRGDVWNESLAPPSSGVAGNPITFDAYGAGQAPNLSGYHAVPSSAWVLVTGNAWKAPVPAGYATINFCLFGSVWGQKVAASTSNLNAQWNFYFANGYVYVYSAGNGLSLKFYLSQKPFSQSRPALIDEQYARTTPDPTTWLVNDPAMAISLVAQTLQVAGGNGLDGQTTFRFIEQIELGGALQLQHGDVSFSGASHGVLGGVYPGAISAAGCLAGFQIAPSGGGSSIQALINGLPVGPVIATQLGHRYVLTTYVYSIEVYRSQEIYHSSLHPAGSGWGGGTVAADVRFVLEVHDIDPSNPATMVAPATVLYDGVVQGAPGFCTYALVNAMSMHCNIAYTYATHISLAEVRTALPGAAYNTQLAGSLSDGAQCLITSSPALDFYPQYSPALNELIVVSYRGFGRAVAEVSNAASILGLQSGTDDGLRGLVRVVKAPNARTGADCESVAQAVLEDAGGPAWSGTYQTWSDFLPGRAADIFPGDALTVNVPSRSASFTAIVRHVAIEVADPANDRGIYTIEFANDLATSLALQWESASVTVRLQDLPPRLTTAQVGAYYTADLKGAQITQVTSTTVQVDAGVTPGSGFGFEARAHDYGWGQANDRNLLGRFGTQTFSLPRLAKVQTYFLRMYDSSSPPHYSRYSAALHLDYPL